MMYILLIGFNAIWFISSLYQIWFNNGDETDFTCLVFSAATIIVLSLLQTSDESREGEDKND